MKSQKTKKQITAALTVCIMLLTPLFWRGAGGEASAQVANGTGAGNCLSYNGVNNYLEMNNQVLPLGAKTIEFWVKHSAPFTDSEVILNNNDCSSLNYGTGVYFLTTGGICFAAGQPGTGYFNISSTSINDGRWHQVAAVWDGTTTVNGVRIFIDGVLATQGTATMPETINATYNLMIGSRNNQSAANKVALNGQIDEVRVWNRALTETEIRASMCKKLTGNETGLVGYWRFDEGSGSTAFDASPNGNDGTLH